MNYCYKCGHDTDIGSSYCPNCGANIQKAASNSYKVLNGDSSSFGYGVLCFFFPIIGLILYLVWKDEYPERAKSCGMGGLIGFISSFVIGVCLAFAASNPNLSIFIGYF